VREAGKLLAFLMLAAGLMLAMRQASAAELNAETEKAWKEYVGSARAQMNARLGPTACFLWAEDNAERMRRLRDGEILVEPADEQTPRRIPGGLIHHWIGAIFVPGATLVQVLAIQRDYDRYSTYYPSIVRSRLVASDGPTDRVATIERHQAMFSRIALDADVSTTYADVSQKRAYSISSTIRLQEIQNYGGRGQHEMEPVAPKAYLWQLSTIGRYEERDGGVYLELEGMALSRDIPPALRWLVDPFVRQASAGAMAASLRQTRDAVMNDRAGSAGKPPPGALTFRAP
jgi:hypothetical protein